MGPISLAGEKEAWKQHVILRNHSQKGAESSQGECQEGEEEGDWNSVIRSGWNWKQSKTSSWLTSLLAHNQKFLSIRWEKSLRIVSPDIPMKK